MKKLVLLFLSFTAIQASFAQSPIIKNVGDFTSLNVSTGIPVTLVVSPKKTVEISGRDAAHVKVTNNNGELTLQISDECHNCDVSAIVNYTALNNIEVSSGASVKGTDVINAPTLSLNASSAGSIALNIQARKLNVDASSAGSIKLSGTVDDQKINVSSAAHFSAKDLQSKQAYIIATSAANATVYATDTATADVSSAATVDIYGHPNTTNNISKEYVPGHIRRH
jgi:hypothetical protein